MSRERLDEHRRIFARRPALRAVYAEWFELLLADLPAGARVLEVGAGPGLLADYARRRRADLGWVACDIIPTPWQTVAANALLLPFRDRAFDAVVCLDVLHHLARPAAFFTEAARVLAPDGRLMALEPWVSTFSYPIYRYLHEEGCDLGLDPWDPFPGESKDAFDGDGGIPFRLLQGTPPDRWRQLGLMSPRTARINGFAYLLTLGFRPSGLLPGFLAPLAIALERALAFTAPLTAMRVLATWRRESGPSA